MIVLKVENFRICQERVGFVTHLLIYDRRYIYICA